MSGLTPALVLILIQTNSNTSSNNPFLENFWSPKAISQRLHPARAPFGMGVSGQAKMGEMMDGNPDSSIEVVKQAIAVSWCCDLAQNVAHRHEIPCLFFVLFVMPNS